MGCFAEHIFAHRIGEDGEVVEPSGGTNHGKNLQDALSAAVVGGSKHMSAAVAGGSKLVPDALSSAVAGGKFPDMKVPDLAKVQKQGARFSKWLQNVTQ